MKRMPSRREWALLGLAAVVVGLSLSLAQGQRTETAVVEAVLARPAAPAQRQSVDRTTAGDLDVRRLRRAAAASEPGNAFSSRSWYVPPPPPPPPPKVAPPPPSAPPLPFVYLGRYVEDGVPTFFLARGDRVLTVKEGDIVENLYRVDAVEGARMTLTYLPLDIQQTLDIGSAG